MTTELRGSGACLGVFISNMANIIIGRLRISMSTIPVPPMGRDMALSYEKLIDKNVSWDLGVMRVLLVFFTCSHSNSVLTF